MELEEKMKKNGNIKRISDFENDNFINLSENPNVVHYYENFRTRFFSFISGTIENLIGIKIADYKNLTIDFLHSRIHPIDLKLGFEKLNKAIQSADKLKFNINYQYRIQNISGDYIWIYDFQTVFLDENKNLSHTIGTLFNINELKTCEINYSETINNYKTLFNSVNFGIFDYTVLTDKLVINQDWLNNFGYKRDEWECNRDNFELMVFENHRKKFADEFKYVIDGGLDKLNLEFDFKSRNDGYKSLLLKGQVVEWDEDDNPKRFLGIIQDISAYKEKELYFKSNNYILKKYIEKSFDGILLYNDKGIITDWNQSLERITGWAAEDIIGKPYWEIQSLLYPDYASDIYSIEQTKVSVLEFLRTGKLIYPEKPFEREIIRKDGQPCLVKKYFFPVQTDLGYFAFGIISDITAEKMLEKELAEYETRLREFMEFSKELIYKFNIKTNKYEFVSPLVYQMLGFTPEEFYNFNLNNFIDLIHKDDLNDFLNVRRIIENDIIKEKVELTVEYRFKNKFGEYKYISDNYSLIKNYKGEPAFIIGNIRDISDLKKQQQMLKDSIEKYKLLVENQSELVIKLDSELKILYASPSYCTLFDIIEDDILEKKFNYHIHNDDIELTNYEIQRVFSEPHTTNFEHRALTKYGWRWLAWSNKAVVNDENVVESIVCVGRDITKRKRIEDMLKRSERDYRRLFDFGIDAIMILDPETETVLELNQKACEMYGYERDKFIGMNLQSFIEDLPKFRKVINLLFSKHKDQINEQIHIHSSGNRMYIENHTSLSEYNGNPAILCINRNITDNKINEIKLKESNDTLKVLLDMINESAIVIDSNNVILYSNDSFNSEFGNNLLKVELNKVTKSKKMQKSDYKFEIDLYYADTVKKETKFKINEIDNKIFVVIFS